jgi:urease gamma subunit
MIDSIDVLTLNSSGKSRSIDDWPLLETYYKDTDGLYPYIKSYVDAPIFHGELIKELEAMNATQIFSKDEIDCKENIVENVYGFFKISKGYFLEVSSSMHVLDEYDESLHQRLKDFTGSEIFAFVSYIALLAPPKHSSLYDKEIEDKVFNIVKRNILKKNTVTPSIGMISQEDGDFYLKDFLIKTDYNIIEGDLHYGSGFMDFHKQLLYRFENDTKGLVLFHGEPGTGKTYYIRSLMKDLLAINKFIIYLPPSIMEFMVSPEMISYISAIIMDKYEDGKSCVLLLEDAEPLLESRNIGGRSSGITNLLNLTDGLLNDMLNVQVIATFNTDLKNIDEALLRPERLIARKEFKKLSIEDSKKLIEYLQVDKKPGEYTLAEIYSYQKKKDILVHEYNPNVRKIGFK